MPHGSRPARVGDLVRQELSVVLRREVRHPDLAHVTITHVRMSGDLQHARVLYTLPSDTISRRDVSRALRRTKPFLRRHLGQRLRLRYVPDLAFEYDESGEQQDRVARLLQDIAIEPDAE